MNKKKLLAKFIRLIKNEKELTNFIAFIFNYKDFNDYNYIFRLLEKEDRVVIDIYDNISNNRFNRYIFSFSNNNLKTKVIKENNVFITYINVNALKEGNNNLYKLAYMFKLNKKEMIIYASTFLESKYIEILKRIIK